MLERRDIIAKRSMPKEPALAACSLAFAGDLAAEHVRGFARSINCFSLAKDSLINCACALRTNILILTSIVDINVDVE